MTPKESHACGLKSWAFGYATLHGNGVSSVSKSKKSVRQHCASNMSEPVCGAWPTREKYKFLAPDTTAPQQGSAASGRQPLNK